MTKEDWLYICRLNMEWYYVQTVFEGKSLSDDDKKWLEERMPSDDIFDDGRIEYFQKNFKPSINENKLDELANEYTKYEVLNDARFHSTAINAYKAGYRKAKEE